MGRGPTITPLDGPAELDARRRLTEAFINAVWRTSSWADADRQAADIIDNLRAAGYELVKVSWP